MKPDTSVVMTPEPKYPGRLHGGLDRLHVIELQPFDDRGGHAAPEDPETYDSYGPEVGPVMRERHRCSACAVRLPSSGGRCPSCGFQEGGVVIVEVGAQRPPRQEATGGMGRTRRLVLGAVLVFALGGAFGSAFTRAVGAERAMHATPAATAPTAAAMTGPSEAPRATELELDPDLLRAERWAAAQQTASCGSLPSVGGIEHGRAPRGDNQPAIGGITDPSWHRA